MFLPELWSAVAKQVDGDLLVVAPNRHIVFATGSRNKAAVAAMKRMAKDACAREPHPVSTTVFRRAERGFVPVEPE